MNNSKPASALRDLRDHISTRVHTTSTSSNRIDASCTIDPLQLDTLFLTLLSTCQWTTQPLTLNPKHISMQLNPFVFTTPVTDAVEYIERQEEEHITQTQISLGEDKSKITKHCTKLYIFGKQSTLDDVTAVIANLFLIGNYISPDFAASTMWQTLKAYDDLIRSPTGKRFAAHFRTHPQLFHHMLLDINNVMIGFWHLAGMSEYRSCVKNGTPIHPRAFREVTQQAVASTVDRLRPCFTAMDLDRYGIKPVTLALFTAKSDPPTTPGASPATTGNGNGTGSDEGKLKGNPRDKNKSPGKDPAKDAKKLTTDKAKGILTWSGTGAMIPHPKVLVPKPGQPEASKTTVCLGFTVVGRACRFGTKCNFLHLKALTDLPAAQQREFSQYVADTPGLDFVHGLGPPPGTTT